MNIYTQFILWLIFLNIQGDPIPSNNVCTNFRAYSNIRRDKHCFYNPDLDSSPYEIALRYGYHLENHTATTEDGYVIGIFRLRKKDNLNISEYPVILQHGIVVDGLSWMISGNNSLSFNLVSHGFDIWLPSFRGSKFSRKHINSTISENDYWNFSFHELGIYDLPAIIEKVAESTKRNDIIYIGHSMGATAGLVYSALKPEHARKHIKGFVYMAPVALVSRFRGALELVVPFTSLIKILLETFRIYHLGIPIVRNMIKLTCGNYAFTTICQIIYSFSCGLVVEQVRPEIMPALFKLYPTGTSIKSLLHFAQIILNNGRFQEFDYGKKSNLEIYNSTLPPVYEIENIQIPTHIFASKNDYISDFGDSQKLYENLKCPKGFHNYSLSHVDYVYGKYVIKLYEDLVNVMQMIFLNNNIEK